MTSSWMLVAGALFATMGAFAKYLAPHFSGAELAFYRSLIAFGAIGIVVALRRQNLRTPFWRGHFWRGLTGTISLVAYFYTMTQLPLATAITLNYTSPLWLTLLSTVLLGERFRAPLVAALLIGFVGVALLLQPTWNERDWPAGLIGLGSGFFAACAYVNVKKLGEAGEPEWRVVYYFGLAGMLGASVVQLLWQGRFSPVTPTTMGPLLAMGLAATLAQLAMTRAYHGGNTLVVGAFAYSTIVFSALIGMFVFGENLSPPAWAGMAIIVAGGIAAKRIGERAPTRQPALPVEED